MFCKTLSKQGKVSPFQISSDNNLIWIFSVIYVTFYSPEVNLCHVLENSPTACLSVSRQPHVYRFVFTFLSAKLWWIKFIEPHKSGHLKICVYDSNAKLGLLKYSFGVQVILVCRHGPSIQSRQQAQIISQYGRRLKLVFFKIYNLWNIE